MKNRLALITASAATALALTACGGGSTTEEDPSAADQAHNDTDVAFATDMIPHHAQALVMVDMAEDRAVDPGFATLLEDIRAAQAPEIETMSGWLAAWGEPVPDTMADHRDEDGGMDHGGMDTGDMEGMPGMMSADELDELEQAGDARFQDMWLRMMIRHHEGAVEMARVQQAEGQFPDAIALAEDIEISQLAEIDLMREMIGS